MTIIPTAIKLKKRSNCLELTYSTVTYQLNAEFLRVYSPSAEVQGHGNPILQYGKEGVLLEKIEPVGQYAVKLTFDDGHDTGLYSWEYLYELCLQQQDLWEAYLKKLNEQGKSRSPIESVVRIITPS